MTESVENSKNNTEQYHDFVNNVDNLVNSSSKCRCNEAKMCTNCDKYTHENYQCKCVNKDENEQKVVCGSDIKAVQDTISSENEELASRGQNKLLNESNSDLQSEKVTEKVESTIDNHSMPQTTHVTK